MKEHREIKELRVHDNKSIVLILEDGSHVYIDPEYVSHIMHAIIMVTFEEYEELDLPFPKED